MKGISPRMYLLLPAIVLAGLFFVHADSVSAAGTLSAQCVGWPTPQINVQYAPPSSGSGWTWAFQVGTNNSSDQLLCSPDVNFPNGPYDTACDAGTTWWQWMPSSDANQTAFVIPASQLVAGQYYSIRAKENNTVSTSTVSNSVKIHVDQCGCGQCATPTPTPTISVAPLILTPTYQSAFPGVFSKITATGGNGIYTWDAQDGIVSGSGSVIEVAFTNTTATPLYKTITATSGGQQQSATIEVAAVLTFQDSIFLVLPAGTSTPIPTPTSTVTPTPTISGTPTPAPSLTPTMTPIPTRTPIPTASHSPTPVPTGSPIQAPISSEEPSSGVPPPSGGLSGFSLPGTIQALIDAISNTQGLIAPIAIASAIAVAVSTVAVAGSLLGGGLGAFSFQWVMGLAGLLPKRKKVWGTVYDANTKRPIPFAKVQLLDRNRRVLETHIADKDGRYGFLTTPESLIAQQVEIQLNAGHEGYAFPSKATPSIDTFVYNNLYFGTLIQVNDQSLINFDIPMDPIRPSASPLVFKSPSIALGASVAALADAGFWIGLLLIPLNFVISPNPFTFGTLCLFLGTASLRIFGISQHPYGTVSDATTGKAMPFALITLNDLDGTRKAFTVSDERGRYFIVADEGVYRMTLFTSAMIVPPRQATITIKANKGWITKALQL